MKNEIGTKRITIKDNCKVHWTEYSREDIEKLWLTDGQGHRQAIERGRYCYVVECEKEDVITIAQYFIHSMFCIPTCTHFNGTTLSLYCGDAGSDANSLLSSIKHFVQGYFLGKK